jgi:hypothetical protein
MRIAVAAVAIALQLLLTMPSHGQGVEEFLQHKGTKGLVLLSVNWNSRASCGGFEDARLASFSFDLGADARGDDAAGDLVVDGARAGTVDYVHSAAPGRYALSGFDIRVSKAERDSGGFKARRSRLIANGIPAGGSFEVRAGEMVYVGHFSVECRKQPTLWRTFPDGPAEFQEYLGRIKSRFPALETGKVQFRPMMTAQFGPHYVVIPALQDVARPALAALASKAAAGDREAQYQLGAAYDAGRDVPRDLDQAIKWYRHAAEVGHLEAQNSVGSALQAEGRYEEAFAWFEKAAARGHLRSGSNLAALYDAGLGVAQDRKKAFDIWSRVAEFGWAEAMWNLANLHRTGALGERDMVAACAWNARARRHAKPHERGLLERTAQSTLYFEKALHAGEIAACRKAAPQWAPRSQ